MNLVAFWEQQIAKWNTDEKCGLCWKFAAPIIESAVNVVQDDEPCCVQVYFLRERVTAFSTVNNYNSLTGYVNQVTCNKSFQLLVVVPSTIGTNNYNEIKGHDKDESKWDTILYKIEDCLSCELSLDFCEFLGSEYRVTQWSGVQMVNYSEKALTGYRITVNFQTVN
jgi:hypothetical protein